MTALLASFPSPDRGVWHLGPLPIRAYALCIVAGIVVAIWWGERRFIARGGRPGAVIDMAVFAVPFGLVGGRLYHVATDWQKYFGDGAHPLDALKIYQGGLGIWGAITLGGVGAWIGARRQGVPLTALADACAPGIVVAQAIGRLGNWFNQELFGGTTSLPWGLEIFNRVNRATGELDNLNGIADGAPAISVVHPTFLYELLWNVVVAAVVVWADRRWTLSRGRAFALYVAGYTLGRFWIELVRTDPATLVHGIRVNVITSVVVFLGGAAYLVLVRGPREALTPETDPAAAGPAALEPTDTTDSADGTEPAADRDKADPDGADHEAADREAVDHEPAGALDSRAGGGDRADDARGDQR